MDNTIRRELKRRRRERYWRWARNFLLIGLIVGGSWQFYQYLHDPDFAFGSIEISGTRKLSGDDILKMSGCHRPVNIFNLNSNRVEEAIGNDVRFKKGSCEYKWPGVFRVTVEERSPAIYVCDNLGSYAKVDYTGMVMSITKGITDGSAPMLVNEVIENVFVGDRITDVVILSVLRFMNGVGYDVCQDFSELKIDEHNNLHVLLKTSLHMVVGSLADLLDRCPTFVTIYNEVKDKNMDVEFIDMRFAKPYVRLRQKLKLN